MDTGLEGRTVLITGAGRNMGKEAALGFAREHANLAICNHSTASELDEVAAEVRSLGATVIAQQCDVTDGDAVARFVRQAHGELGRIDVVVNCASYRCERPFLEETYDDWLRGVAVNLTGPFHVCRNIIPIMIEQRWGRIINIGGVAPYRGVGVAKSAVKLGIVGFTRGLAREFGKHGITANCVAPGAVERTLQARENFHPLRPEQPLQRKGTAEEVVSLMVYLASERAAFVTGQSYLVNGGSYFQ